MASEFYKTLSGTSTTPKGAAFASATETEEAGAKLRRADIQLHIDKIEARKKALQLQGRELLARGKQDTAEYQTLVDKHRMLRGKQRFFEDMQNEIDISGENSELNNIRAAQETRSEALDRLKKEGE